MDNNNNDDNMDDNGDIYGIIIEYWRGFVLIIYLISYNKMTKFQVILIYIYIYWIWVWCVYMVYMVEYGLNGGIYPIYSVCETLLFLPSTLSPYPYHTHWRWYGMVWDKMDICGIPHTTLYHILNRDSIPPNEVNVARKGYMIKNGNLWGG